MKELTLHQQLRIEFAKTALHGLTSDPREYDRSANGIAQRAWTIADEMMAVGQDIGFVPRAEPAPLPCGCPDDEHHFCMIKETPAVLLPCGCHPASPLHHCTEKGKGSAD